MSVLHLSNSQITHYQRPEGILPSWPSRSHSLEIELHPHETRGYIKKCKACDSGRKGCILLPSGKLEQLSVSTSPKSPMQNKADILPSEVRRSADAKLIIVMVGLPARGKSYISKKVCRYLNLLQHDTMIFNVGNRRRKVAGRPLDLSAAHCSKSTPADTASLGDSNHTAGFFDPDNIKAGMLREKVAMDTLDEALHYLLREGGSVAIFDATNSTTQRRKTIIERVQERGGSDLKLLFVESQCCDQALLQSNMQLKLSSPDYKDQDPVKALEDFKKRVAMYEKKYVPVGIMEEGLGVSYCQIIDVGRKFVTHNIDSFLTTQVANYLQRLHLVGRQVWLTRHSEFDGGITSDPGHNLHGIRYAAALSRFIDHERDAWNLRQNDFDESSHSLRKDVDRPPKRFHLWTSMTERSFQTAKLFDSTQYDIEHIPMLDDLDAQILGGALVNPTEQLVLDRQQDGVLTQYPGTSCEEYSDVTKRFQSVILELERVTGHVLLIGGLAVIRALLAYCRGLHRDLIVDRHDPSGTVYMLEPKPYGVDYKEFSYNPETDWFIQSVESRNNVI